MPSKPQKILSSGTDHINHTKIIRASQWSYRLMFLLVNLEDCRWFIVFFSNSPSYNPDNTFMEFFITDKKKILIRIHFFFCHSKGFILKLSSFSIYCLNFFDMLELFFSFSEENFQTIIRTLDPSSCIYSRSNDKSNMKSIHIIFDIKILQKTSQSLRKSLRTFIYQL